MRVPEGGAIGIDHHGWVSRDGAWDSDAGLSRATHVPLTIAKAINAPIQTRFCSATAVALSFLELEKTGALTPVVGVRTGLSRSG
ncbi:hypothetical protein JY96_13490 [Aquabacterium sp. NJ1]|uniref:hypothetical protein n=1 Tax=Aquabacterium sp. NJ1 TaxID=1538295 RepID=UPI00052CC1E6|nr:hypothetical protein [Aquabacterium sp. NJ1]KGM40715.1 hypothetical protein JY96_13490 [Aquabacterium sp. NJ1]